MDFASLSHASADAVQSVLPSLFSVGSAHAGTATTVGTHRAMTAAHLLEGPTVELTDAAGQVHTARVLAAHAGTDLAVLELPIAGTPVRWADSARVGELVLPVALGSRGPTATLGLLAGVLGPWVSPAGAEIERRLEVDGSLPPGFSGGPLVGAGGVIGLNTHRLVRGGTTLPAETVRRVLAAVASGGAREPGFLGVVGARVALGGEQAHAAGQDVGFVVLAVPEGSPAVGVLQVGDVLLRVGGHPVEGTADLRRALSALGAGVRVQVDLLSGVSPSARELTLGNRPPDA